jgi:hypothetical protein
MVLIHHRETDCTPGSCPGPNRETQYRQCILLHCLPMALPCSFCYVSLSHSITHALVCMLYGSLMCAFINLCSCIVHLQSCCRAPHVTPALPRCMHITAWTLSIKSYQGCGRSVGKAADAKARVAARETHGHGGDANGEEGNILYTLVRICQLLRPQGLKSRRRLGLVIS